MSEMTQFSNPPAPMGTGRLNSSWKRILSHFHSQAVAKLSPLVSNASGRIVDKVDGVAASILRREVELLNKHPNEAMLLSQTTVLKMDAARAYERTAAADAKSVIVSLSNYRSKELSQKTAGSNSKCNIKKKPLCTLLEKSTLIPKMP